MALRSFLVWLGLLSMANAAVRPSNSGGGTLPFRLHRDYLVIADCDIPGAGRVNALIDTGTTRTIIDARLGERLGVATTVGETTAFNQQVAARVGRLPELVLGPLRVNGLSVFVLDLSQISAGLGTQIDAMIGMDVLRASSFSIDYRRQEIVFGPQDDGEGKGVALDRRVVYPVVEARVAGAVMRLKIDTGINGLLLYRDRLPAGALSAPDLEGTRAMEMRSLGGETGTSPANIGDVWIGPLRLRAPQAALLDHAPGGLTEFDGVLGPRSLPVAILRFDFERMVIVMRR